MNEAVETAYALEDRVGVHLAPIVVNGVDAGPALNPEAAPAGSPMALAAEFRTARRLLHEAACCDLSDMLALHQLVLPHLPGAQLDAASVEQLAHEWDAQ